VEDINSVCDFHNSQINIRDAQTINFVKTIKHSQKEEEEKNKTLRQFFCVRIRVLLQHADVSLEQEGRKRTRIVIYDS
jgi:hypothetical protein